MRTIKNQLVGLDPNFSYRGLNQTRVETFSDAVFALAITLVALSGAIPDTFEAFKESFREIIPFLICVVLITVIWYQHYTFFLRYGLQDRSTIVINTGLLFFVLIYVYPLKFLSRVIFEGMSYTFFKSATASSFLNQFQPSNMSLLFIFYGLGAACLFMTISWLYRHAYNKRVELELSDYEIYSTKVSLITNLLLGSIPFLSAVIAAIRPFGSPAVDFSIAGFIYFLYPPVMIYYGMKVRRLIRKKFE